MKMDNPTIIDLIRHGKPEGGEIFRGKTDVPLSELGFEQMRKSSEKLEVPKYIVSSPMLRCIKFANELSDLHNVKVYKDESLSELSFGDWDGKEIAWVKENYPDEFKSFWQNPVNFTPPNAEPMVDFQLRVSTAFWQQVESLRGEHILMVAHGGVIRVILSEVLKADSAALTRFEVPYASVSQIRIYHHGDKHYPQLVFHNA